MMMMMGGSDDSIYEIIPLPSLPSPIIVLYCTSADIYMFTATCSWPIYYSTPAAVAVATSCRHRRCTAPAVATSGGGKCYIFSIAMRYYYSSPTDISM